MATFVYSPAVRVRIDTIKQGILDVSEDLVDGTLTRREGAVSSFQFSLQNTRRKYDGVFTPMDRIVVEMKRIRWVRVYSGYLNSVPMFTVWPRVISITSSCTLKRLQQWYWDSNSAAATAIMLPGANQEVKTDGGTKDKAIRLLTEVAKWPQEAIHISQIPANWFEFARPIAETVVKEVTVANYYQTLGSGPTVNGQSPANVGPSTVQGIGPGTGSLPASSGKISWFGGPEGGAYGPMQLTAPEKGVTPNDQWYCAMRWPYSTMGPNKGDRQTNVPGVDQTKARAWWKNRRILITNPANGKTVVVRAADWGPAVWTGKTVDVSKTALQALGAKTGETVQISFAPEGAPLGAYAVKVPLAPGVNPSPRAADAAAAKASVIKDNALANLGSGEWGSPAQREDMVTITLSNGMRVTVNKKVSKNFQGFLDELLDAGYDMKTIGGYEPRKIANSSKWSNHAWGAAVDIDPFALGNGFDRGTKSKIGTGFKGNQWIAELARKWGLGWGGEWSGAKDWMHFEAIGSPSAARYKGAPVDLGIGSGDGAAYQSGALGGSDDATTIREEVEATIDVLFKAFYTSPVSVGDMAIGEALTGPRALINDTPFLPYLTNVLNASMRTYSSAPNGDFIAWFPDYFGIWGTAARMNVRSIELLDFTVDWADDYMVTHQFVVGANVSRFNITTGEFESDDIQTLPRLIDTKGIASVDFPSIMKALLGIEPTEGAVFAFRDWVLSRFGARPVTEFSAQIAGGGQAAGIAEFFMALFLFMRNWTQQFSATVPMTFMPELYPGMLLTLPEYSFQAYVTEVTHRFRFGKGGGFMTDAKIAAPARTSADAPSVFGLLPLAAPASAPINEPYAGATPKPVDPRYRNVPERA